MGTPVKSNNYDDQILCQRLQEVGFSGPRVKEYNGGLRLMRPNWQTLEICSGAACAPCSPGHVGCFAGSKVSIPSESKITTSISTITLKYPPSVLCVPSQGLTP